MPKHNETVAERKIKKIILDMDFPVSYKSFRLSKIDAWHKSLISILNNSKEHIKSSIDFTIDEFNILDTQGFIPKRYEEHSKVYGLINAKIRFPNAKFGPEYAYIYIYQDTKSLTQRKLSVYIRGFRYGNDFAFTCQPNFFKVRVENRNNRGSRLDSYYEILYKKTNKTMPVNIYEDASGYTNSL